MITRLLFLVLISIATPAYADDQLDRKIQSLLEEVQASSCLFIRNGHVHSAEESALHINRKYTHYRKEIDSIDSFIRLAATKSLFTGKEYLVDCDGQVLTSAKWMSAKAAELGLQS